MTEPTPQQPRPVSFEAFKADLEQDLGVQVDDNPDSLLLTEAVLVVESWGVKFDDRSLADIADLEDLHHYFLQAGGSGRST